MRSELVKSLYHLVNKNKGRFTQVLFIILCTLLINAPSFGQYSKVYDFGATPKGIHPYGTPVYDGTWLYGTVSEGGALGFGTLYKIKPDGSGFTKLLDFDDVNGSYPYTSLLLSGSILYGTTAQGGTDGHGTVFKINTNGTGFTKIFDLTYMESGAFPFGSLISDGTFLYGTTTQGGINSFGTVFKIKTDGTGYVKLYDFDGTSSGAGPFGGLYSDGTFLYGMTSGNFSYPGTIFKIKPDGTSYSKLMDFTGASTGKTPYGSLISDGTFLYGTTVASGANNEGVLFKIKFDGTGFTKLVDFSNSTGAFPKSTLVYDGNFLYGMTTNFGANAHGTIFKVKTDGSGFVTLQDSDVGTASGYPDGQLMFIGTTLYGIRSGNGGGAAPFLPGTLFKIKNDGTGYAKLFYFEVNSSNPQCGLISDGTNLYGTSVQGGLYDYGTVYKIKPDGTGYVKLADFDGVAHGRSIFGGLVSDGTFLYGVATSGGVNDQGTVFKIKTDGTGFTKLWDFSSATSGGEPQSALIYDGTYLYGTTAFGGANDYGTIFKIKPDGSGFLTLLNFDYNTNGSNPNGSLYSDGTFLYGAAPNGGVNSNGLLYKIKPDGTGFLKLLDFDDATSGNTPNGGLISLGSYLFGMTNSGGSAGFGTIYKIKSDGSSFLKLKEFDGNSDGGTPNGSLVSDGTFLYGVTANGGQLGKGTMFRMLPDGTSFTKLLDLNDGSTPVGPPVLVGGALYDATTYGGASGNGILFKSGTVPYTTISEISPSEGVVGTYVTITGTDFNLTPGNNVVKFNGVAAKVLSATATTLTVIVPVGVTTGPVTVGAAQSFDSFIVEKEAAIFDGTVQNCNVTFVEGNGYDAIETFVPVNPGDKIKISWKSFNVDDILYVYDGPDTSSQLVATLYGSDLPADITATGPGGELTFFYSWQDEDSEWEGDITCISGPAITVTTQATASALCNGGTATFTTAATGTTNIAYQWQNATVATGTFADISDVGGYSGTGTASLVVNTKGNFGAGFYRCKISGDLAPTVYADPVQLTINTTGCSPVIATTPLATQIGGKITLNLVPLITTNGVNLDLASLKIAVPPSSGATASIDANGLLTIDYTGKSFSGIEQISITACDVNGNCSTQSFSIDVAGDIVVYNAVSPNGANPSLVIEHIEVLPDTKNNSVYIFDRWQNQVWHGINYDNSSVVFTGVSDGGSELPTGVYYYKISFGSGRKKVTGYISLKR